MRYGGKEGKIVKNKESMVDETLIMIMCKKKQWQPVTQDGKHGEIWYYALLGRKHVNKGGVLDCKLRVRWKGVARDGS